MPAVAKSRAINRRALLAFIAVLVVLVLAFEAVVVWLQRQHLLSEAQEEVQNEMVLLGELAMDSLLRSDYAAVQRLVKTWLDRHDYLAQITAVLPNGFVLADFSTTRLPQEPLRVSREIVFNGRVMMTLQSVSDFSLRASGFAEIVYRASLAAISLILLLGWLLWWTLKRTAIQPLEAEIRAREAQERQLRQRTRELETSIRELESFSYSVSHDLRGPLRAIDGFSHALTEDYGQALDATAQDYIARTRAAAQRMGVLIDELLALARMARQDMHITSVDLSALARAVLAHLAQTDPHPQPVEIRVEDDMLARADAALIGIALDNLLGNAWKYTARTAAARIEFRAVRQNGQTVYVVQDNGAGFDMQYADKLFRPFERLHSANEFAGNGIGLATVQRIIARHGGRVWAEARPGRGATFYFTLTA
jgi:signal transduction histidine kinase